MDDGMTKMPLHLFFAFLMPWTGAIALAQDWSRFRGPEGRGVSDATSVPTKFSIADYNWKVNLPGPGHSSPVVWGDRLFLTVVTSENEREVACFDTKNGARLWDWSTDFIAHNKHRDNEFASSTPCLDERNIYVFWTSGDFAEALALTHEGELVWRHTLGNFAGDHGSASSPILVNGGVFVFWDDLNGTQTQFALLDPKDGSPIWQKLLDWDDRQLKTTYSTPAIYVNSKGKTELIVTSQPFGMLGLDAANGDELWRYDHGFKARTVGSPVVAGDVIFATWGSGNGAKDHVAVVPGTETDDGEPKVAWRWDHNKGLPYVPTPIFNDGLLYLWKDDGLFQVVEAKSGEVVYGPQRVGGRYFSNPILIGDKIYCGSRDLNEMVVLQAGKEFKVLARNELDAGVNATPAVAGGRMFVRTNQSLISVGGR